ncbi:MAG TPA: DUF1800 domain-containing protein [Fimbriimonadaceae bacterium]|nr:DUF1800 domain-containing protein [Fimbriimonadaceae bacterium]
MTDPEKIAHLLRRFGMGAGTLEMAKYEPLGVQGTLDRLLNYDKVDEAFPIGPWEIAFEKDKSEVYADPGRFAAWWCLRLLMSERPLEQKLALFWHSHLVVGADKVEFGPTMVEYLETLRVLGGGEFRTLLAAVSKTPAMIKYLDGDANFRGSPNENFGREVMELFTLGIGHYSEDDVKNAARAFTGFGLRFPVYEGGAEAVQARLRDGMLKGNPMLVATYSPALHDDGPKTILGETKNFDCDEALSMLAGRAETAKHLGKKLFEFFAYRDPSPEVVDKVAAAFTASGGNIRKVLRAIAEMDEFWSEACVRRQVKSPVDFCVTVARQMNIKAYLLTLHKPDSPSTPLHDGIRGVGGMLLGLMSQQGMLLFFPPNVKGWDWGEAWITPNNMSERMKLGNLLFSVGNPDKGLPTYIATLIKAKNPADDAQALEAWLQLFDAEVFSLEKKHLLLDAFKKAGGLAALNTPDECSTAQAAVARLVFGAPEFQLC